MCKVNNGVFWAYHEYLPDTEKAGNAVIHLTSHTCIEMKLLLGIALHIFSTQYFSISVDLLLELYILWLKLHFS